VFAQASAVVVQSPPTTELPALGVTANGHAAEQARTPASLRGAGVFNVGGAHHALMLGAVATPITWVPWPSLR
jgi:hypothetical protein